MNQPGGVDAKYVAARKRLLDALDAMGEARVGVVVVGAQAVYLRVAMLPAGVVAYTTDGDIAVDPRRGTSGEEFAAAMQDADFGLDDQPGIWRTRSSDDNTTTVDLMVPAVFSPERGKRSAFLDGRETRAARYVRGVEGCLADNDPIVIGSLDPADSRSFGVAVAGPAALVIAKLFKVRDRLANTRRPDRIDPKDGYEIFRLLQLPKDEVVARWRQCLSEDVSRDVAREALGILEELFTSPDAQGSRLAAEYVSHVEDTEVTRASVSVLAREVVAALS